MARRMARVSPEARQSEILDAARRCFTQRGYHETTVDDIAERAGISKGAIYWHFHCKREVFLALLDLYLSELDIYRAAIEGAQSAEEALRNVSEAILASLAETLPMIELTLEYMAHASRDEDLRGRFRLMYSVLRDLLAGQVERGIGEGRFAPIDSRGAASGILAAMDGLLIQKVLGPELELAPVWRLTVEILIRGLAQR